MCVIGCQQNDNNNGNGNNKNIHYNRSPRVFIQQHLKIIMSWSGKLLYSHRIPDIYTQTVYHINQTSGYFSWRRTSSQSLPSTRINPPMGAWYIHSRGQSWAYKTCWVIVILIKCIHLTARQNRNSLWLERAEQSLSVMWTIFLWGMLIRRWCLRGYLRPWKHCVTKMALECKSVFKPNISDGLQRG